MTRRVAKPDRIPAPPMDLIIFGTPPSKKNSRVIDWRARKNLPSVEYSAWIGSAVMQIRVCAGKRSYGFPVRVEATFYRDLRADLDNLVCSLGDALQQAGVVTNDRLIRQWNARLVADGSKPRIECVVSEI